ncbi:MAG TPA: TatD family hydrolase [Chloroflexota bacterium]|nr:TatD family hydrolase [Chloroflexota bacterium]
MLADSHAHLHAYGDAAVAGMLARAFRAGVGTIVAVSVDLASAERTIKLAGRYASVVAAVGLHPAQLEAIPFEERWLALERLAEAPEVEAIGECGVDETEAKTTGMVQLAVFARHCRLAVRLGKPLLLHLVGEALIPAALGTLAATGVPAERAVVHYFAGDAAVAQRYLEAGLLISVGKPVTRPENAALREAVRAVPLDRLLLETDTYPLPGRTTEPSDLRLVADAVAELKGLSPEQVAAATTANLERLLHPAPPDAA